ncbi:MAG TPA: DUF481 domain-containing protein, partial [Marinagarivorans sp.]
SGDKVVWTADKVGEITIKKGDISDLTLPEPVKLRGFSEPCEMRDFTDGMVSFACANETKEYSLLSLHDVVPFSSYEDSLNSYGGKLTLVGTEKSGNVESSDWLAAAVVNWRLNDFRHDFELRYTGEYLKVESEPGEPAVRSSVSEYYKGFYGINWFFMPRWYLLGDLTAEKDDAKQIAERYIAGLGSGFQWWESDITALKLEASFLKTKEYYDLNAADLALGTDDRKDFTSGRLAVDFRYLFPKNIAFFHRSNISQNLDDSDDWRANADTGFNAPLGFGISASLLVTYDYLNQPQEGVEKSDTTYRVGVSYSW